MKLLHILKSEPDTTTETLLRIVSEEAEETTRVSLYEGDPDYATLIDLIFSHDRVISWW